MTHLGSGTADAMGGLGGISQFGAVAYVVAVQSENSDRQGSAERGFGRLRGRRWCRPSAGPAAHVDFSGATVTVGNENDALCYETSAGSTGTRVDLQVCMSAEHLTTRSVTRRGNRPRAPVVCTTGELSAS